MGYVRTETTGQDGLISHIASGPQYYNLVASDSPEENVLLNFLIKGFTFLMKYSIILIIPMFIIFLPFGIFKFFKNRNENKWTIIIFSLILAISFLFPSGKALKYSYQVNDITQEPIIAPFTYSILKTETKLQNDLDEKNKSVPFMFNRSDEIVSNQKDALSEFFAMTNELRHAIWRLEESKRLVYERRYHKQYEKARSEFVSDSANLSILTNKFHKIYSFTVDKPDWLSYITPLQDPKFHQYCKPDHRYELELLLLFVL